MSTVSLSPLENRHGWQIRIPLHDSACLWDNRSYQKGWDILVISVHVTVLRQNGVSLVFSVAIISTLILGLMQTLYVCDSDVQTMYKLG